MARVIMNRPQYLNAQSRVMIDELDDAFAKAVADDEVRVIVLSGNGEHFSSGHDIGTPEQTMYWEARGGRPTERMPFYNWMKTSYLDMSLRWRNLPKPTIAMVQGYCIFGGWMFASSMDLIFAADDAKFLAGHTEYFPVPWDLGVRKAKDILFESRFIGAKEALEAGFVSRVIPREKLEEETLAYAHRVAENDPFVVQLCKFSVNHAQDAMGFTNAVEPALQAAVLRLFQNSDMKRGKRMFGVDLALKHVRETQE
ncbi:MAG: enoyl-CoA hydratase [Chloroflexota bacterium]|nr:MAG: enoyl-CoA hydratase [Chloroflexota bacterium]